MKLINTMPNTLGGYSVYYNDDGTFSVVIALANGYKNFKTEEEYKKFITDYENYLEQKEKEEIESK